MLLILNAMDRPRLFNDKLTQSVYNDGALLIFVSFAVDVITLSSLPFTKTTWGNSTSRVILSDISL